MNCEELKPLLTGYLLGELDEAQTKAIENHLSDCVECRAEADRLEATLGILQDVLAEPALDSLQLDADLRERIFGENRSGRVVPWIFRRHAGLALAAGLMLVLGMIWLVTEDLRNERRGAFCEKHAEQVATVFIEELEKDERLHRVGAEAELKEYYALDSIAADADDDGLAAKEDLESGWADDSADVSYARAAEKVVSGLDVRPQAGAPPPPASPDVDEFELGGILLQKSDGVQSVEIVGVDRIKPSSSKRVVKKTSPLCDVSKREPPLRAIEVKSVDVSLPPAEVAAPPADVTVQEAKFDSVATVKSPLIMKRVYGSRAAGVRGSFRHSKVKAAGGIGGVERGTEVRRKVKVSGRVSRQKDAPLAGRLFISGKDAAAPAVCRTVSRDPSVAGKKRKNSVVSRDFPHGRTRSGAKFVDSDDIEVDFGGLPTPQSEVALAGQSDKLQVVAGAADKVPVSYEAHSKQSEIADQSGEKVAEPVEEAEKAVPEECRKEVSRLIASEVLDDVLESEVEDKPAAPPAACAVNPFVATDTNRFSTFGIDVDTASYTIVRNLMQRGEVVDPELVRTEEFVNYFDYGYRAPVTGIFAIYTEVAPSKFGHGLQLLKIGVKGRRLGREEQRPAVLTFLVDTSGSMDEPERLGLVKSALEMLLTKLGPQDLVAIVQYDEHARLVLEHTPASRRDVIIKAICSLECGGATNLEEGMGTAYRVAADNFVPKGENRVLLLSDGAANLGSSTAADILKSVSAYRRQGITCSVFGFGTGTYNDAMLEELANRGDGSYAFIDSKEAAKKVLVDDLAATLNTIAFDVKIQVEFNPVQVRRYRQLGYENRRLAKQDFRNDAVDAGEVGSGQSATALYELELTASRASSATDLPADVLAVVRVRYRRADNGRVEEIQRLVRAGDVKTAFEQAGSRFRLAACVAEFAEIMRQSPYATGSTLRDVADVLRPVAMELKLDSEVRGLLRLLQR